MWHESDDKFWICNVAAANGITTDLFTYLRVTTCYLIYNQNNSLPMDHYFFLFFGGGGGRGNRFF